MTPLEQEMLAALKKAKPVVADYIGDSETLCMIVNAIAKAEPKPQRWICEDTGNPDGLQGRWRPIREVKPITREQIKYAWSQIPDIGSAHFREVAFLRELGIDVVD